MASKSDPVEGASAICQGRGFHDDQEFIDPQSGGFVRCRTCGRDLDCEDSEEW